MEQNRNTFQELGASIVAISVDPADKSKELASKLSIGFPLLEDKGLKVIRQYGVADEKNEISLPALFVVDQGGAITWKYIGKGPPDRPLLPDVLNAVKAIGK
ncbi:MAG: peroxiredoxin family protein [Proteobacteria bacterium]|nr:peroxiredoxin family protein [Pseudomonadota bacterium]